MEGKPVRGGLYSTYIKKTHSVFHPKNEGFLIKEIIKPHEKETVLTKEVNSAFIGTSLQRYLNNLGIKEVVITPSYSNEPSCSSNEF